MSAENNAVARSWLRRQLHVLVVTGIGIIVLGGLIASGLAQNQPQDRKTTGTGYPDLVAGLKATPGCLGVETAKTASGKEVIFAWFEDKKAVLIWYYSDTHQQAQKMFFPDYKPGEPLKDVPDNSGPIMAIASITMAEKSQLKETSLPISQIAIELYQPLSGGLFLGGRFAPDSLKAPKMRDYTPKKK